MYSSIMEQWFGVESMNITNTMFGEFETIEIIGDNDVATDPLLGINNLINKFLVYPNPLKVGPPSALLKSHMRFK